MLQNRKDVEPCQPMILAGGAWLELALGMFLEEPRQELAQSARPAFLSQGGGRIAAGSHFAQKLLRPEATSPGLAPDRQ